MQWGGPLTLFDTMTSTQVTVRTFGAFEGTIARPDGEAILQPMLLEAVRAAAAQHGGGVLQLAKAKDAIAIAAQALLAPRLHELGAVGQLSIAAFTLPPEEHERLSAFVMQAAIAKRAAAAAEPPAVAAVAPAAMPQPQAAALAVGAAVRVQWSDGQHYPGVVRECRPDQVLVAFRLTSATSA